MIGTEGLINFIMNCSGFCFYCIRNGRDVIDLNIGLGFLKC